MININGFIVLLSLLFIGNIISEFFALPIPGSIIGMVMLFIILIMRKSVPQSVDQVSSGLISIMGMLFVPAGVGISQYFDLLARDWFVIFFTAILTTFISLAVSAYLFTFLMRRFSAKDEV